MGVSETMRTTCTPEDVLNYNESLSSEHVIFRKRITKYPVPPLLLSASRLNARFPPCALSGASTPTRDEISCFKLDLPTIGLGRARPPSNASIAPEKRSCGSCCSTTQASRIRRFTTIGSGPCELYFFDRLNGHLLHVGHISRHDHIPLPNFAC